MDLSNYELCFCELSGDIHLNKKGEGCELCNGGQPSTPQTINDALRFLAERSNQNPLNDLARECPMERNGGAMTKDDQIKFLRETLEIIAGRRQCIDNLLSNAEIAQQALAAVEAPPASDRLSEMVSAALKAYDLLAPELKNAHDREQRHSFLRGMCPSHWDCEAWCKHVDKWCEEKGY